MSDAIQGMKGFIVRSDKRGEWQCQRSSSSKADDQTSSAAKG
jgi:hypothetical protein